MMNTGSNTLYISDLDGTLLRSDQRTSAYTNKVINALVDEGLRFSYATARSYITASQVAKGLHARFPVVVYNGAFILDNETQDILLSNYFADGEAAEIRAVLAENQVRPIVYSFIGSEERFSWQSETPTEGMARFLCSRKNDGRERPVRYKEELYDGRIFYFICIDSEQKLSPINDYLKTKYNCVFHKDIYSGDQWLEILPRQATKANAVLWLKDYLNCGRIISFGDGRNDIPMFGVSDECYAVENAVDELRAIATGVIPGNNEDGVAKWLSRYAV